jgi:TP901 family phage tail tape measure protein
MAGKYAQELVIKLTVDNGQITAALGNTKRSLNEVSNASGKASKSFGGLTRTMKQMALSFVIYKTINLMTQAFTASIKSVAEFELAMNRVRAITGATDEEFKKLTNSAQELAIGTMFTATQVAELQLAYSKLGFTSDEILKAAEATLNLATVTGDDLAGAADVVGATIRGFGLAAEEADRVVDVMGASFTSTALNIEHFKQSMKTLAPISVAANIPLETTTALLGVLANQGLRGTRAATGLKNIMSALSDPTSELSKKLGFTITSAEGLFKAFRVLGEEGIDLAAATGLIDERAKPAFITLANGIDTVKQLTETFNVANGVIEQQANIVEESLSVKWDKFFAALDVSMQRKFGDTIKDMGKILDFFTKRMALAAKGLGETGNIQKAIKELNELMGNTSAVLSVNEIPLSKLEEAYERNEESIRHLNKELFRNNAFYVEQGGLVREGQRGHDLLMNRIAKRLELEKEDIDLQALSLKQRYMILDQDGIWIHQNGMLSSAVGATGEAIKENVLRIEDLIEKKENLSTTIQDLMTKKKEEIENDKTKIQGLQDEIRALKQYEKALLDSGVLEIGLKDLIIQKQKELNALLGDGTKEREQTEEEIEQAKKAADAEIKAQMKVNTFKAKQTLGNQTRMEAEVKALEKNIALIEDLSDLVTPKEREAMEEKFNLAIFNIKKKWAKKERQLSNQNKEDERKDREETAKEIREWTMDNLAAAADLISGINDIFQVLYDQRLTTLQNINQQEMDEFNDNQKIKLEKFTADQQKEIAVFRGSAEEKAEFERMKAYEKIEFEQQQEDRRKKLREKQLKEENEIGEKAFKANKKNSLAQIAINTALGIMQIQANKTVNSDPTLVTLRSLMIGLITASGIAQAAAVSAQRYQPTMFQKGGLLVGDSHQQGGIPFTIGGRAGFEAEGGEFMFSKKAVDSLGVGFLNALNNQATEFRRGGVVTQNINALAAKPSSATYYVQSGGNMGNGMELLKQFVNATDSRFAELESIMSNIKVTNVATETSAVSASVINAKAHATF